MLRVAVQPLVKGDPLVSTDSTVAEPKCQAIHDACWLIGLGGDADSPILISMRQFGDAANVGLRRSEEQASRLLRQSCRGVDVEDDSQMDQELRLEVPRPPVVGTELGL